MLRSRGRVFYTIARLEKVWSCVDPMECATATYYDERMYIKADLYLLRGGGGSSEPSEPPLGTALECTSSAALLLSTGISNNALNLPAKFCSKDALLKRAIQ